MTWLDGVVFAWVVLAALVGFQRGLTAQLVSLVGLAAGALVGARVGPLFLGDDSPWIPLASLVGALVGAIALQAMASVLGSRLRRRLARTPPLRTADGAAGVFLGAALGLVVAWLCAVAALQLERPGLTGAVKESAILSGLVDAVPPRSVLRTLARLDPLPLIAAPPDLRLPEPDPSVLRSDVARRAADSVLKVQTLACGVGFQGSGWVAGRELVATNVHVVTGAQEVSVVTSDGEVLEAVPVYVDADDDVALLRVDGLEARVLRLARQFEDGEQVVMLGYPKDGPLTAAAGTAGRPTKVFATDAYGNRGQLRTVVPLRGRVQRGDSGGAVLDADGRVVAMMFAASTEGGGGFGVPVSELRDALDANLAPVDPGPCAS